MNVWIIVLIIVAIILIVSAIVLSVSISRANAVGNVANGSREAPNVPAVRGGRGGSGGGGGTRTPPRTPSSNPIPPRTAPGTPSSPRPPRTTPGTPSSPTTFAPVGYLPTPGPCTGANSGYYGIIGQTTVADCTRLGGRFNSPAGAGLNSNSWVNCHMNICQTTPSASNYIISPTCPANDRTYGVVTTTTVADCRALGGSFNESQGRDDQWVRCHSYMCKGNSNPSTYFYNTIAGSCPQGKRIGYGTPFTMIKSECDASGGRSNLNPDGTTPRGQDWVRCHFDLCRN